MESLYWVVQMGFGCVKQSTALIEPERRLFIFHYDLNPVSPSRGGSVALKLSGREKKGCNWNALNCSLSPPLISANYQAWKAPQQAGNRVEMGRGNFLLWINLGSAKDIWALNIPIKHGYLLIPLRLILLGTIQYIPPPLTNWTAELSTRTDDIASG